MKDNSSDDCHLTLEVNSLEWQVNNDQFENSVKEDAKYDHEYQKWRTILDMRFLSVPANRCNDRAKYQGGQNHQW